MPTDKPASFHGSPQEAMQAPPEEFLYLACLHEGTGVDEPDFLAVVDAEDGADRPRDADAERRRRAPPLRLEPLQLGLPRARPLAPDRARLPLLAHPRRQRRRRPAPAADREGDRAGGARREDRLHAAAHRPLHAGRQRRHLHARRRRRQRRRRLRRASTRRRSRSRAAGRTAASTPPLNYDFWYQPRKNVLVSSEFGEPNAYEQGFDLDDVAAGRYGQRLHFWNLERAPRSSRRVDLGETGLVPLEVRWLHDPEAEEGFVGAALSSTMWHFRRDNGGWAAEQVIDGRERRARGLAASRVPGADHRPRPLDGRPLPLLLELAARRPAPVRRLRPRQPEADRPALARRRCSASRATPAAS